MASNNTSVDIEEFEGFSDNEMSLNYVTNNLFNLHVSQSSDNISITFYKKSTHAKMFQILQSM